MSAHLGCRFPPTRHTPGRLVEPAFAVGAALAEHGVIGRFAVDFVAAEDQAGTWHPYAVEINLRNGGTTHPMLTLQALIDGSYDVASGSLLGKHYLATDHLEDPLFARLTPDDLLDVAEEHGPGWDAETGTGIAFHMASAIAAAGVVGVTAIGNSPAEAGALSTARSEPCGTPRPSIPGPVRRRLEPRFPPVATGQQRAMFMRWIWRTVVFFIGRRLWNAWQRRRQQSASGPASAG